MSDVVLPPPPPTPVVVPVGGSVAPERPRRRTVLVAAMALLALAGGGVGLGLAVVSSSGPTVDPSAAAAVLKRSLAAAGEAGSFHYVSSSFSSSSSTNSSSLSQLTVGDAGKTEGQQTITVNGVTFDVVVIGFAAFLRGDADALEATLGLPVAVAEVHAGQWISLVPGDAPYQSVYAAVTTMQAIADNITFTPRVLLGTATVGGTAVEGLRGPMEAPQGQTASGTATLYVDASGRPLPVRYTEKGKEGTGSDAASLNFTIAFSSWGKSVTEPVPSGAVAYASLGVSGSPGSRSPAPIIVT